MLGSPSGDARATVRPRAAGSVAELQGDAVVGGEGAVGHEVDPTAGTEHGLDDLVDEVVDHAGGVAVVGRLGSRRC